MLVSWHDFKKTPGIPVLKKKILQMKKFSNNIKIVTMAKSINDASHVLGYSCYQGLAIVGAIRMGNVTGLQFHPERSGPAGLEVLKNFILS